MKNQFANGLDAALKLKIEDTCKRIYRLLTIDGYARIDLRLNAANELYFIEANPNPHPGRGRRLRDVGRQSRLSVSAINRSDHSAGDEYLSRVERRSPTAATFNAQRPTLNAQCKKATGDGNNSSSWFR